MTKACDVVNRGDSTLGLANTFQGACVVSGERISPVSEHCIRRALGGYSETWAGFGKSCLRSPMSK